MRPCGKRCAHSFQNHQGNNAHINQQVRNLHPCWRDGLLGPWVHDAPTAPEQPWTLEELRLAIQRPKLKKSPDETSLTAELLQAAPEEFLAQTLAAFNIILEFGRIRGTWKLTTFSVLPKKPRATQTTDLRRIASSRLFYKVFGYLILGRVAEILEVKQPEEQHGFRPGRRLEEHLLTANLLLDKAAAAGIRVWIVGNSRRTRGSRTLSVVVRECI